MRPMYGEIMKRRILIFLTLSVLLLAGWIWLDSNYYPPILMYHTFDYAKQESVPVVDKEKFLQQMQFIKKAGYNVVSLDEMLRMIKSGKVKRKTIAITFDDGLDDNKIGVEILDKMAMPATIFVIVNNIGSNGYMTREEVKAIDKNTIVEIESHTLSHRYIPDLSKEEIKKEIVGSKLKLAEILEGPVDFISYPVGGYNEYAMEVTENSGYKAAFATNRGDGKSTYAIKRIKVSQKDGPFKLWVKLTGFYHINKSYKKPY